MCCILKSKPDSVNGSQSVCDDLALFAPAPRWDVVCCVPSRVRWTMFTAARSGNSAHTSPTSPVGYTGSLQTCARESLSPATLCNPDSPTDCRCRKALPSWSCPHLRGWGTRGHWTSRPTNNQWTMRFVFNKVQILDTVAIFVKSNHFTSFMFIKPNIFKARLKYKTQRDLCGILGYTTASIKFIIVIWRK